MTATEEIIVSGEDFIERRVFVYPQPGELESLRQTAYSRGYNCGWTRGFLVGVGLLGFIVLCLWWAAQW